MIVKIKVNANVKYELTNFGYIKAESMVEALFENEHVTKKHDNVTKSIQNLLYDGREIEQAYYDALTNVVELHLKEED